jgi:hypothetical protein
MAVLLIILTFTAVLITTGQSLAVTTAAATTLLGATARFCRLSHRTTATLAS